ncbi:Maintenance of telomere capping protein 6 [Spathaspora sp. JA1]|nr:Maintenance of telomere capping protein 6 [Spathaspora sp. JA1]
MSVPIDQISNSGGSLSSMIFDQYGYTVDSLSYVDSFLTVGVQTFMIDLYWNEFTQIWQLCPSPFPNNITSNIVDLNWNNKNYTCDTNLSTQMLMNRFENYISETNTNFEVNLITVLLNLKSIHYSISNMTLGYDSLFNYTISGNSTLNSTFSSLGTYIFTPEVLQDYRNTIGSTSAPISFYNQSIAVMPSLHTVLYTELRRVMINVVSDELVDSKLGYNITSNDKLGIFFDDTLQTSIKATNEESMNMLCDNLVDNFNISTTNFRFIIDNDVDPFTLTSVRQYIRCGLTPIFNATTYTVNSTRISDLGQIFNAFIPFSLWSWAPFQPAMPTYINSTSSSSTNGTVPYRCVVLNSNGWEVANCYDSYSYACQNETSPYDWIIDLEKKKSYVDIQHNDCPDGYIFSLPRSNGEMLSLLHVTDNDTLPIWIDLNDLTVENCFVYGGPYAQCPYQKTITTNTFVRAIAPSAVVGVVILVLIFMEKVFRVNPIQTNRKRYWKRALQDYYEKNDYEGVPS